MPVAVAVAVAVFVAVALVALAVATQVEQRQQTHSIVQSLGDYGRPGARAGRQAASHPSLAARVLLPAVRNLLAALRRATPGGYLDRVRHELMIAGRPSPHDLDAFLVARVLSLVAVPVVWLLAWRYSTLHGTLLVAVEILVAVAGLAGPEAWLDRTVSERKEAIRSRLPDVLDLLTISVEAGLGFEQALTRTVSMVPGALSEEFARMLGELRAGASRADALSALDARTEVPELRTFVLALLQADTFGVSVGTILRTQAGEIRNRRRQQAQERAQKAPVKMLFPMVFCIMPALFVVVAGPAVISIFHAFNGQ